MYPTLGFFLCNHTIGVGVMTFPVEDTDIILQTSNIEVPYFALVRLCKHNNHN